MTDDKGFRFTAEDFKLGGAPLFPSNVAAQANALLDAYVKTLPVVHSLPGWNGWHDKPFFREGFVTATHTAKLWGVKKVGE